MNKKIIITFLIIGIIVAAVGAVAEFFKQQNLKDKVVVSGVQVEDFTQKANFTTGLGDVEFSQNPNYQIVYLKITDRFMLSVQGVPFAEHRTAAEEELLEVLEISKEEACETGSSVTVPGFGDPEFAGQSFPLSFCE